MKKNLNKKVTWRFPLSLVIFCVFIYLALATARVEGPKIKTTCVNGVYSEKEDITATSYNVTTGETDKDRLWHGKVTQEYYMQDTETNTYKKTSYWVKNYYHGYEHGKTIDIDYKHDPPKITTTCHHMGKYLCLLEGDVECDCSKKKSTNFAEGTVTAFDILSSKYPFFLFDLAESGIKEVDIKAYVDTIETKLCDKVFHESDFENTFTFLLADFEGSNYDSVYQIHDLKSYNKGYYNLKFAEFRKAVVEAYRNSETNTYNTVSSRYPNLVPSLFSILEGGDSIYNTNTTTIDSMFQLFFTDFDSLMASYGPLDLLDPFYIDSIDLRMLNSLVALYTSDETSSKAVSKIKSAYPHNMVYDFNGIRKLVLPMLAQIKIDPVSSPIADLVVKSLAPYFYKGDKIRLAVHEAYNLQKAIITLPVTTTEFIENSSSSSAVVKGFILENGGAQVTERGIVWATFYNPTLSDNMELSGSGLGEFEITLSDLSPLTEYYVRTYAKNSAGISYGNCIQFTTLATDSREWPSPEIDFTIYPNPASQKICIDYFLDSAGELQVMFVDKQGQIVFHEGYKNMFPGKNQININISGLKNGTYICMLHINGNTTSKQFLVLN